MAGKSNPFSRAIATKKAEEEPTTPVEAVPAISAIRDDELAQVSNDGNAPEANTPDAGSGEETFGLGDTLRPGKEVGASVQDDAAAAAESPPESKAAQFGLDVTVTEQAGSGDGSSEPVPSLGGSNTPTAFVDVSPRDQVQQASGDHGPALDLTEGVSLEQAASNLSQGEALTELNAALGSAIIDAASATESQPSVAAGGIVQAADDAVEKAAFGLGAAVAAGGSPAKGAIIVAGGQVYGAARAVDDLSGGEFGTAVINSIPGARQVADAANFVGEVVVAANGVAAGAITPGEAVNQVTKTEAQKRLEAAEAKKKAEEEEKRRAEEEEKRRKEEEEAKKKREAEEAEKKAEADEAAKKKADAETSTDPDDDRLTPDQAAARAAIKAELGYVRIPGDIDPVDGDGTNTGTASEGNLSAADRIVIGGITSLVGNPGTPGGVAPTGGGGTVTAGPDGREILLEDGDNFNIARGEDEPDFNVGQDPLVGFQSQDEEEEESESGKQDRVGSLFGFNEPDKDADDDA